MSDWWMILLWFALGLIAVPAGAVVLAVWARGAATGWYKGKNDIESDAHKNSFYNVPKGDENS